MSNKLKKPVSVSWLSEELGLLLCGADIEILQVRPLNNLTDQALTFSKKSTAISTENHVLVIGPEELADERVSVLVSDNPRLDFILALELIEKSVGFEAASTPPEVHPSVKIGKNVVVENGVEIGEGSIIYHNVVLREGIKIGRSCLIKSGAVIGEEGFGFERNKEGVPIRMLQLGSVTVGDNVEIGSLTTICRGALGDTVIEDHVKIDDRVHIAHNCIIRQNVIITPCVELSGGVKIGKGAWLGPNCSVLENIEIGENALIGIGSVVIKHVADNTTVLGNPARMMPSL